jgi:hypothetical protein
MTEMDKLIELARDPEAYWTTAPPPQISEPESNYYMIIGPDARALALKLLKERWHRPREA